MRRSATITEAYRSAVLISRRLYPDPLRDRITDSLGDIETRGVATAARVQCEALRLVTAQMMMASTSRTILLLRLRDVDAHVAERAMMATSRILILNILAAVRRLLSDHGLDLANIIRLVSEYVGLLRQLAISKQLIIFESKLVRKVMV